VFRTVRTVRTALAGRRNSPQPNCGKMPYSANSTQITLKRGVIKCRWLDSIEWRTLQRSINTHSLCNVCN